MKELSQKYGSMLIQNRDTVREAFPWESGQICLASAIIFTMKGKLADEKLLRESKKLIAQKVGVFSNFRGMVKVPTAAILAASGDLDGTLDKGLTVYGLLKKEFWQSSYLPLAAMMIVQMAKEERYEELAARTRRLYDRMRKEHPFLTSSEDSPFCAMLALSNQSDDRLIEDMEKCYKILKQQFVHVNAVQSLSHVLALFDEPAEVKCEKTMQLYQSLREAGGKYGTNYELPALGVLAMTKVPVKEIVQELMEIDTWLAKQKGFGFWGGITAKQRMMYAGMLAQKDYVEELPLQAAAVSGTMAMVIAQETALCAALVASITVTAANSSSSS
ncbi:MAG: DUF4003 domain-containing protein [Eubacterium sp.]|nr:DUF4003 domain-containing protein [Eubacterium sp.]